MAFFEDYFNSFSSVFEWEEKVLVIFREFFARIKCRCFD